MTVVTSASMKKKTRQPSSDGVTCKTSRGVRLVALAYTKAEQERKASIVWRSRRPTSSPQPAPDWMHIMKLALGMRGSAQQDLLAEASF